MIKKKSLKLNILGTHILGSAHTMLLVSEFIYLSISMLAKRQEFIYDYE